MSDPTTCLDAGHDAITSAAACDLQSGFCKGDKLPDYVNEKAFQEAFGRLADAPGSAADLVRRIYARVLERDADDSGLITFGSRLERGEMSVRDVVRAVAKSSEHQGRFFYPSTSRRYIEILYDHLLARGLDPSGAATWLQVLADRGVDAVIDGIVNSVEYARRFGRDGVPGNGRPPIYPPS